MPPLLFVNIKSCYVGAHSVRPLSCFIIPSMHKKTARRLFLYLYYFLKNASEESYVSLSRSDSRNAEHIAVTAGKVRIVTCIPYKQRDEQSQCAPVALTERVEHIQLVIELRKLVQKPVRRHSAEIIKRPQPLKFQSADSFELIVLTENCPLF